MNPHTEASKAPTPEANGFITRNEKAVRKFLKTVVIADNEAQISPASVLNSPESNRVLTPARTVKGKPPGAEKENSDPEPQLDGRHKTPIEQDHQLDLPAVVNAFSKMGIICGTYLPIQGTAPDDIANTLVDLGKHADVSIFDWQLHDSSTGKEKCGATIDAIVKLLKDDEVNGARLRLIVVYTGEVLLISERDKLEAALKAENLLAIPEAPHNPTLLLGSARVVFCNKKNALTSHIDAIAPADLPKFIIKEFSKLSTGLLRSYALACVAAIRDDVHRLMAQYNPELDGAFVSQRAFIPNPQEASEMMHDIMISDLATVLRSDAIEEFLDGSASIDWFNAVGLHDGTEFHRTTLKPISAEGAKQKKQDQNKTKQIISLADLQTAIKGDAEVTGDYRKISDKKDFDSSLYFIKDSENETDLIRHKPFAKISQILLFSECRGSGNSRNPLLQPRITQGTVIKKQGTNTYGLCIVPRCDSVRFEARDKIVKDEQTSLINLPFIELELELEPSNISNNIILLVPSATEAQAEALKFPRKKTSHNLLNLKLVLDNSKNSIFASGNSANWIFTDGDDHQWEWVGTLRESVAQSFVSMACNALNRVGTNEFEWLRRRKPK